ncbi:MAG TPA: methyltransferase domain-containing protein [Ktedonobacteraceae bacterium]|nr:methyltransferase domain-containing protein [Ktedonobacteraceae bacterium]
MFGFHWFFGKKKHTSYDRWEQVTTAKIPQPVQDSRRYLENSDYQLPKDEEEDIRLNFQHHALFHAIGNHYIAPIHPPLPLILDVGTGTGIWANEMARLFPLSTVVGVDLSDRSFKRPSQDNCLLRTGNVLTGLSFPEQFFNFTHQRLLVAGITAENWPRVIHELVRVTRLNGWVELVEVGSLTDGAGPATAQMQQFLVTVSQTMGFDGEIVYHLGEMLQHEGLQGVETQPIPIPVGEWAGRVGQMMKHDLLGAVNALRGRYCAQAGIAGEEFDQLVREMALEWEVHRPTCTFHAVYGRRVSA